MRHFVASYLFLLYLCNITIKRTIMKKYLCLNWILILATLGLGSCNDNIEVV